MTFCFARRYRRARLLLLVIPAHFALVADPAAGLTLEESEQLALSADPAIIARESRALALQDQAVADGQLPDPKLLVSVWNVPLDDFSMKKEPMSQLRTGISQAFPRGDSLQYRRQRSEWLSKAETAAMRDTRAEIRRNVRETFLELYYQEQATRIIEQTRSLFEQLVDITRAHYASGRVSQQDVLLAQLELSRLDDRATGISQQRDVQRAALSRWIGEAAWAPIDATFPLLPAVPTRTAIERSLPDHPAIKAASATVEASQQSVSEAREQYKPGFEVGVQYLKRFGNNPDGSDRPDQMAAMLTMDLPLFTEKRQDKRLSASQQETEAAIQTREQTLRELRRTLASEYARWQRLGEQETLYQEHLLREASASAEAAVNAYQSGTNEFTTLMRARITELDIRLQDMRIRIDRARTQARLLYLLPEPDSARLTHEGEQP
jgi:outer membrane protein TolC